MTHGWPIRRRAGEVNALADASPGFVWRLQGESADATSVRRIRRSAHPDQHVGLEVVRRAPRLRVPEQAFRFGTPFPAPGSIQPAVRSVPDA
ncbi:MAG: DUF3291 domain-containing protein [Myxococcales bacterium]|nr:DUF3291 domain-containing protein [Myxococcales bacterium]